MKRFNPIDLLPIDHPIKTDPSIGELDYFYKNVVKHLIPDVIKIMNNGVHIDLDKVATLNDTVTTVLEDVTSKLASNQLILDFQAFMYPKKFKAFSDEQEAKKRILAFYLKEYKGTIPQRTYVVNTYLENLSSIHAGKDKWTIKDLKGLHVVTDDQVILDIINSEVDQIIIDAGMLVMAEDKLAIYNKSIDTKTVERGTKEILLPPFNPGSNKQKRELFEWLKVKAIRFSKDSGEPSWNREAIEELQTTQDRTNTDLMEVLQLFVDHSFSAIIKNNFIESFKKYTIDGILYGNIKLFGAKSFRLTSSNPNLLNQPSTGSIYAKSLKECFVAPPGYVVVAIDLDQLEDRVIANLSGDDGKCSIFLEGIDSHIYNSLGFHKEDYEKVMELTGNLKVDAVKAKELMLAGNKDIENIRQHGKSKTFKLSYGGYPDIDKGGVITQEMFDNYHNILYPGITKFRDEVITKAEDQGYTHLGLGCRMYSSDINKDSLTIFNANSQFWSVITLLCINKFHSCIDNEDKDVRVIATIYDSIYMIAKEDVDTIHWVNETIVPIITTPIFKDEIIHNSAVIEIGRNWANLTKIPNGCSIVEIEKTLKELKWKN